MKIKLENFNIAYGSNDNGLTVEHDDKFFDLDTTTMINVIAGSCFSDWDDEDTEEFEEISDLIENFVKNNNEEQSIAMWFN